MCFHLKTFTYESEDILYAFNNYSRAMILESVTSEFEVSSYHSATLRSSRAFEYIEPSNLKIVCHVN